MGKKDFEVHFYFKVKYGYKQHEFVTVEAGAELEKAIYAWIEGIPAKLGDRIIHGKSILAIEPDFHKYTGWYRSYEPKHEDDYKQIERDMPKDIEKVLSAHHVQVAALIGEGKTDQIGNGHAMLRLNSGQDES